MSTKLCVTPFKCPQLVQSLDPLTHKVYSFICQRFFFQGIPYYSLQTVNKTNIQDLKRVPNRTSKYIYIYNTCTCRLLFVSFEIFSIIVSTRSDKVIKSSIRWSQMCSSEESQTQTKTRITALGSLRTIRAFMLLVE